MRTLIFFVAFSFILACEEKTDANNILGSWRLRDVVNKSEYDMSDKMTFFPNDSVSVEIFQDGEIVNQISGTYQIDPINEQLISLFKNEVATKFDIVRLTSSELELSNPETKRVDRYVRY
jgi:hypothetical protein